MVKIPDYIRLRVDEHFKYAQALRYFSKFGPNEMGPKSF